MRKTFAVATLLLAALSAQAQEKVMNIVKTDGTSTQTRVAELQEISFLTAHEGGQGLLLKTTGGETVSVLFETNPIVTISSGKMIIKSDSADKIEIEITDIAEILFGDTADPASIRELKGFSCVLQDGAALICGIPEGISPRIYSVDGQSIPTPSVINGELRLNRTTMGEGIFIVKVGTFSTKIKL